MSFAVCKSYYQIKNILLNICCVFNMRYQTGLTVNKCFSGIFKNICKIDKIKWRNKLVLFDWRLKKSNKGNISWEHTTVFGELFDLKGRNSFDWTLNEGRWRRNLMSFKTPEESRAHEVTHFERLGSTKITGIVKKKKTVAKHQRPCRIYLQDKGENPVIWQLVLFCFILSTATVDRVSKMCCLTWISRMSGKQDTFSTEEVVVAKDNGKGGRVIPSVNMAATKENSVSLRDEEHGRNLTAP